MLDVVGLVAVAADQVRRDDEPVAPRASTVAYRTTEGHAWRLRLSAQGARAERVTDAAGAAEPDVTGSATASDLVLVMYGHLPVDALDVDGDRRPLDGLGEWEPEV